MRLSLLPSLPVRVYPHFFIMNAPSDNVLVYLQEMFPADAASIKVILVNINDINFRSRAIVAREDGQFGRPLFQGSEGHSSPEASAEDLLFLIIKDIARTQGAPQPTKQEFDERVKANWEGLKEESNKERGEIAWLEYQVRIQYRQGM